MKKYNGDDCHDDLHPSAYSIPSSHGGSTPGASSRSNSFSCCRPSPLWLSAFLTFCQTAPVKGLSPLAFSWSRERCRSASKGLTTTSLYIQHPGTYNIPVYTITPLFLALDSPNSLSWTLNPFSSDPPQASWRSRRATEPWTSQGAARWRGSGRGSGTPRRAPSGTSPQR